MTEKILNGEKRNLNSSELKQIADWQARRALGEPLAYILGERGFYKHIFFVGPGVLIPRPETEFVVEEALAVFSKNAPENFVEFGFGSGCIGLSLLKEWPSSQLTAFEKSKDALYWAQRNVEHLKLENQVQIFNQDVESFDFSELKNKEIQLVVSNPPYIAFKDKNVEANVKKYEPHQALYSGNSGLECLQIWTQKAYEILEQKGFWIFEFGSGQTKEVCAIIESSGFTLVKVVKDYAGHDRVIVSQK